MSNNLVTELVFFGNITGARGIKGELKVKTDWRDLTYIKKFYIGNPIRNSEESLLSYDIRSLYKSKNSYILSLCGINSRNEAEKLIKSNLYISRISMPPLPEEEYYYSQLIGLPVLSPAAKLIGSIKSIHNFGAGDILDIKLALEDTSVMIPFKKDIITKICLDNKEKSSSNPSETNYIQLSQEGLAMIDILKG